MPSHYNPNVSHEDAMAIARQLQREQGRASQSALNRNQATPQARRGNRIPSSGLGGPMGSRQSNAGNTRTGQQVYDYGPSSRTENTATTRGGSRDGGHGHARGRGRGRGAVSPANHSSAHSRLPDERLQQDPSQSTTGDIAADPNSGRHATGPNIVYYGASAAEPAHGGRNVLQTGAQPQGMTDPTNLDETILPATVEQETQKPCVSTPRIEYHNDEPIQAEVARDGRSTHVPQEQIHQPSDVTLFPGRPRVVQNPPRPLEGNAALAQSMHSAGTGFIWNYSDDNEVPQPLPPTTTEPRPLPTVDTAIPSQGEVTQPVVVEHYLAHHYVPSQSYAARAEPIVIDTANGSIVCTCARQGQGRGLMGSRYADPNDVSITMERNFIHHCPVHPRADIYNQETPSTARRP